jgi:hypothetical protein
MDPAPPKLQPALFGGLFIGVLSALPLVNLANCCCLWVIAGGVLATYLLQQNSPYPVTTADGALVGLLAGLIGGTLGTLLSIPIEMAMGPFQQRLFEQMMSNPDIPPETRALFEGLANRGLSGLLLAFRFTFAIVLGAVFGMLGGLLGVALFKKNLPPPPGSFGYPPPPPPPGVIDLPPPPPPPPPPV